MHFGVDAIGSPASWEVRDYGTRLTLRPGNARIVLGGTLVCVELPRQIQPALEGMRRRGISQYSLLALTPHVSYALEKKGWAHLSPEDYHSEEDINNVGLHDLSVLDRFCDTVDDFLQSRWSLLREEELRPASLNWYYLKILFNSVSIRAFIARQLLEKERPQHVFYFGTRNESIDRDLFFIRESPWSSAIPVVSNTLGIRCQALGASTDPSILRRVPGAKRNGISTEARRLARRVLGNKGVRLVKRGLNTWKVAKASLPSLWRQEHRPPRPTLLTLERGYSLAHLFRAIDAEGSFDIFYWDGDRFQPPFVPNGHRPWQNGIVRDDFPGRRTLRRQGTKLWSELKDLPELRRLLIFWGVDCYPILERRLQHFFQIDIPEIAHTYFKARSLFRVYRPFAVLASTLGDSKPKAISRAAGKEGIPFIVYRHGDSSAHLWGGGQSKESWQSQAVGRSGMYIEKNEFPHADYVLAFGDGEVKFFEGIKKNDVQIIPVGSAALDHLKKTTSSASRDRLLRRFGLNSEQKTVMYVLSHMEGSLRAAPYHLRSPTRMYDLQRSLLEVFSEYPNIQFVLKLPDSPANPCSPIAQLVQDRGLRNCAIITAPFTSVISMADLFVIDVASTTFLEMLTTDRPILFCAHELPKKFDPGEWNPTVLEMWQERVAYSDDLREFLQLLRDYLDEARFQPVKSNDTLLKLFGTHLDDGKSADRAHDFLKSLAHRRDAGPTTSQG